MVKLSKFHRKRNQEKNLLMVFIKGIHHKTHSYTYRKIMIEFLEMKRCQICGSNKNLIVHHIDGNRANNKISNLVVLCQSCHLKIHRGGINERKEISINQIS
jgi:5-methylcytosine-specific restriction endonuclease McrA